MNLFSLNFQLRRTESDWQHPTPSPPVVKLSLSPPPPSGVGTSPPAAPPLPPASNTPCPASSGPPASPALQLAPPPEQHGAPSAWLHSPPWRGVRAGVTTFNPSRGPGRFTDNNPLKPQSENTLCCN